MRTTVLTTTALLGLALLAPAPGATAAAETCRGETATIVGKEGRRVTGTEGRDVVVTNGATQVDTAGGNDLVCISGRKSPWIGVETGAGDDFVDGTASNQPVFADLGTGQDGFAGGRGDDRVALDLADTDPRGDAVGGGRGTDTLTFRGAAGDVVVDGPNVVRVDGRVRATFGTFEHYRLQHSSARSVTFTGSGSDETLVVDNAAPGTLLDVDLGAGDDSVEVNGAPAAGSSVAGGDGRDHVAVAAPESGLALDLLTGELEVGGPPTYTVPVAEFEDADLFSPSVGLYGTRGRNRLGATSCFGDLLGRGGDDRLRREYDGTFETDLDCRRTSYRFTGAAGDDLIIGSAGRDELWGGTGRDRLRGLGGNDELVGGAGRDRADGGKGRDRCSAERRTSCER